MSKLTEQQRESIVHYLKSGMDSKQINEAMGLTHAQTMAAIHKAKIDLGMSKKRKKKKAVEEEISEEQPTEEQGLTVEDYHQKIIDSKDAHIKDLKEICMALANRDNKIERIEVGELSSTVTLPNG